MQWRRFISDILTSGNGGHDVTMRLMAHSRFSPQIPLASPASERCDVRLAFESKSMIAKRGPPKSGGPR